MYENFMLCKDLKPKEKCFRVRRYDQGNMIEEFHEHVPSHRLSSEENINILRSLIGRYANWDGKFILNSRLNNRKGGPSQYPTFTSNTTYPESGAIRHYLSSTGVTAWVDTVITPGQFRQNGAQHEHT